MQGIINLLFVYQITSGLHLPIKMLFLIAEIATNNFEHFFFIHFAYSAFVNTEWFL